MVIFNLALTPFLLTPRSRRTTIGRRAFRGGLTVGPTCACSPPTAQPLVDDHMVAIATAELEWAQAPA
ncbi:MAG: hypothetical protein OWU33_16755 [Firmicutes bacterium]|nr:hypothetical protein [Bacillota bacterium]